MKETDTQRRYRPVLNGTHRTSSTTLQRLNKHLSARKFHDKKKKETKKIPIYINTTLNIYVFNLFLYIHKAEFPPMYTSTKCREHGSITILEVGLLINSVKTFKMLFAVVI